MSEYECPKRKVTEVTEGKLAFTRRHFLTGLATAVTSIGLSGIASSANAAAKKYKVCSTKDVQVKGASIFSISAAGNLQVLITQPKKDVFRAFNPACTHAGFRIRNLSGSNLVCSAHGAQFDTTTGNVTRGPAQMPLGKYNISVSAGSIYITL